MKITLCGSIAFHDEMLDVQKKLEQMGHEVKLPPTQVKDEFGNMISVKEYYNIRKATSDDTGWIWERKEEAMKSHFAKIEWSDVVLILNYDKNNITGYIGANTLMEMGIAQFIERKIYLLNSVPDISYKEEILGTRPIVINNDLEKIK